MNNPYEELGVSPAASPEEIEAAARAHAKANHPDAGGDRDAFDRGRRALIVLRDPKKRAHYDATGEADDAPENLVFAQAMNLLTQKLGILLSGADPEALDVVGAIRQALRADKANIETAKRDQERQIARLEKFAQRLKMKAAGKENLLVATVHAQIGAHRQMIAQANSQIEVATFALGVLEDYIYEIDPTTAAARRNMGGWDLGGPVGRHLFETF